MGKLAGKITIQSCKLPAAPHIHFQASPTPPMIVGAPATPCLMICTSWGLQWQLG